MCVLLYIHNPKSTSRELGHSTAVLADIKSGGLKMAVRVTVRQPYQPSRAPGSWTQGVGLWDSTLPKLIGIAGGHRIITYWSGATE